MVCVPPGPPLALRSLTSSPPDLGVGVSSGGGPGWGPRAPGSRPPTCKHRVAACAGSVCFLCISAARLCRKRGRCRALVSPHAWPRPTAPRDLDRAATWLPRPPDWGRSPRPWPRPKLLAVTQHRHVRAVRSWQVSRTDRSPGGGRSAFLYVFVQKKSTCFICIVFAGGSLLSVFV